MKKLLIIFTLLLFLLGCTNIQVGQTVKKNNLSYLKLTNNDLFFIKDNLLSEEYYSMALTLPDKDLSSDDLTVLLEFRYYPKTNKTNVIFKDLIVTRYRHGKYFEYNNLYTCFESLMFFDHRKKILIEIKDLSNIDTSVLTNAEISHSQIKDLYEMITKSDKFIVKVLFNVRSNNYVVTEITKQKLKEFLEVSLNLKTYDI